MSKRTIETWSRQDPRCTVVHVPEWRFGLLFFPIHVEGDLPKACVMQKIGEARPGTAVKISRFLLHNGLRYVTTGSESSLLSKETDLWELVEVTANTQPPTRLKQDYYNGALVLLEGRKYVMCRPIKFQSAPPQSVEETAWKIRRMYAFGGYFASKHKTYGSMIREAIEHFSDDSRHDKNHESLRFLAETYKAELADNKIANMSQKQLVALCLKDPLYLEKPWLKHGGAIKTAKAKAKPLKLPELPLTADDHLARLIASIGR